MLTSHHCSPSNEPFLEGFCTDKDDGNYPHPYSCTHYIACVARSEAYDMPCALNHDGCLLHYVRDSGPDPLYSRCAYPEAAGCNIEAGNCPDVIGDARGGNGGEHSGGGVMGDSGEL